MNGLAQDLARQLDPWFRATRLTPDMARAGDAQRDRGAAL
jgi:hypothetical protein